MSFYHEFSAPTPVVYQMLLPYTVRNSVCRSHHALNGLVRAIRTRLAVLPSITLLRSRPLHCLNAQQVPPSVVSVQEVS